VSTIQFLNPDNMGKPYAPYSNIARVKAGEFLFIAGQIGTDKDGKAPADFEAQCDLVFANIGAALTSQGAGFANVVAFTTYLVHSQDIAKFAAYRAREFPRLFPGSGGFPPNTLLIIDRLVREDLLVEIAAVAAL
jgi:enamine deaminase RidA (YjgF/YER057c/UK114 family)